jgi:adenylate cyclase
VSTRLFPFYLKVFLVLFVLVGGVLALTGYTVFVHQERVLFEEKLGGREDSLRYFTASLRFPLAQDDVLRMNTLAKVAGEGVGVVYSAVVAPDNLVVAHNDPSLLGTPFFEDVAQASDSEKAAETYRDFAGERVLDLARQVRYQGSLLGTVHLGIDYQQLRKDSSAAVGVTASGLVVPLLIGFFLLGLAAVAIASRIIRMTTGYNDLLRGTADSIFHGLSPNKPSAEDPGKDIAEKDPFGFEQSLNFSALDLILGKPLPEQEGRAFRQQVTIVFASVKGFLDFARSRQPTELVENLNEYFRILTENIHSHGGYVDKIIGDTIVGIFGVSVYREDHTTRAVKSAIQIQKMLKAGDVKKNPILSRIAIGISTGVVLSGNIGSHNKLEYTSIGDSIKDAHWLNGLADMNEIVINDGVHHMVKGFVAVENLTPKNLIGNTDVVTSYRVIGTVEDHWAPAAKDQAGAGNGEC